MSRKRSSPFDLFGHQNKKSKNDHHFLRQFPRVVTEYFVEIHKKENVDFSSKIYHNGTILFQCHRKLFMWNIIDTRVTTFEIPLFIATNKMFYFLLPNMSSIAMITTEGSFRYFPNTSLPEEFMQTQLFSISNDQVISVSEYMDDDVDDQKLFILTNKSMYRLSLRGNAYKLKQIRLQSGLFRRVVGCIFPASRNTMMNPIFCNGYLTAIDKTRNKIQIYRALENCEIQAFDEKEFPGHLQVISFLIVSDTIIVVLKNMTKNNFIEIHRYPFRINNSRLKNTPYTSKYEFHSPKVYRQNILEETPHFITNTLFYVFSDSFVYFVLGGNTGKMSDEDDEEEENKPRPQRTNGHVRCKNVVGSGIFEGSVYVVSMKDGIQSVFTLKRAREVPFFASEKEKLVFMVSYFTKNRERMLRMFESEERIQRHMKLPAVKNEMESFFISEVKKLRSSSNTPSIVSFSKYIAYLPFSKIYYFTDSYIFSHDQQIKRVEKEPVDSAFVLQQVEKKVQLFDEYLDFLWNIKAWASLSMDQQIEVLGYGEQLGVLKGLRDTQNPKLWSTKVKNVRLGNQVFVECISKLFGGEMNPAHVLRFFESPRSLTSVFRAFPDTMTHLLASIPENNKEGLTYTSVMIGISWFRNELMKTFRDSIDHFFRANPRLYPLHPSDARPVRPCWPSLASPYFPALLDEFLCHNEKFLTTNLNRNNRTSQQRIVCSILLDQQIFLISMLLDMHKMSLRYHQYTIYKLRVGRPQRREEFPDFSEEDREFHTLLEKRGRIERAYYKCKAKYLPGLLERGRIDSFKDLCVRHLYYEGFWMYVRHLHPNDTLSKLRVLDETFDHLVDNLPYHMIRVLVKKRLYHVLMIYSKRHYVYMDRFMKDQHIKISSNSQKQQQKQVEDDEEENLDECGLDSLEFSHLQFLWAGWMKRYLDLLNIQTKIIKKQRRFLTIKEYRNHLKRLMVTFGCLTSSDKKMLFEQHSSLINQQQEEQEENIERYYHDETDWLRWYSDLCFLCDMQIECCDVLDVYPEYLHKHVLNGEELISLIARSLRYENISDKVTRINQEVLVNHHEKVEDEEEEEEENQQKQHQEEEEEVDDENFERNLKRLYLSKLIIQREKLYETKAVQDLLKITWKLSFEKQLEDDDEEEKGLIEQIYNRIRVWRLENEDQVVLSLIKDTPLFQCFFDEDSDHEKDHMMKESVVGIMREMGRVVEKDGKGNNMRNEVCEFIIRNFDIICW